MRDDYLEQWAQLHRTGQEAFNAGDFEAAFAGLAPDVEWRLLPQLLETGTLRGRQTVIDYFRGVRDGIDWRVEAQGFESLGPRTVLVHQHGRAVGNSTGIPGEQDWFQVWETGPQGVVRVSEYATRDEALAEPSPSASEG